MSNLVGRVVANLESTPPTTLTTARDKLRELIAALRGSVEEMLAASQPSYSAISDRITAIEVFVAALADLDKAEAAATIAFERVWKRLCNERNEQRIWNKLRTLQTFGEDQ